MRIISGQARGRRLKSPRGVKTRPTSDRVREALFNILSPNLYEAKFLDLFAGTGAVGIEALSRGVRLAVFIDTEQAAVQIIHENLRLTGFSTSAEVYQNDALSALDILVRKQRQFDLIFVDPPYAAGFYKRVLEKISLGKILDINGIVILESDKREEMPEVCGELYLTRQERYGDTILTFYSGKKKGAFDDSEGNETDEAGRVPGEF